MLHFRARIEASNCHLLGTLSKGIWPGPWKSSMLNSAASDALRLSEGDVRQSAVMLMVMHQRLNDQLNLVSDKIYRRRLGQWG